MVCINSAGHVLNSLFGVSLIYSILIIHDLHLRIVFYFTSVDPLKLYRYFIGISQSVLGLSSKKGVSYKIYKKID